jgi:hypothetical protein
MDIKKNITSFFMVPTLKVPNEGFKYHGYINAFVKDLQKEIQYEDCIYVLFKPINIDAFREFLDGEYERTDTLIDDYDYEDGLVVLVYKLNPKFKKDFQLIKEGKYSKTSNEFKEQFQKIKRIEVNGLRRDELSMQWRIFNKTSDLREYWEERLNVKFDEDQEVWKGWDEENEILNINKIKEYV